MLSAEGARALGPEPGESPGWRVVQIGEPRPTGFRWRHREEGMRREWCYPAVDSFAVGVVLSGQNASLVVTEAPWPEDPRLPAKAAPIRPNGGSVFIGASVASEMILPKGVVAYAAGKPDAKVIPCVACGSMVALAEFTIGDDRVCIPCWESKTRVERVVLGWIHDEHANGYEKEALAKEMIVWTSGIPQKPEAVVGFDCQYGEEFE